MIIVPKKTRMQYELGSAVTALQNFQLNKCYIKYLPFLGHVAPLPSEEKNLYSEHFYTSKSEFLKLTKVILSLCLEPVLNIFT